ncbi:MAG: DUF2225 domain-containing protein [Candidatus Rifleibacteriota bacterium]
MKKPTKRFSTILYFTLVLILLSSGLYGTSSRQKEVTCPVCGQEFTARALMSTNTFGGFDSDLCPHAMGSSPLHIRIWSCPSCFFSGYGSDFEQNFSEQKKAELKQWLKKNFKFPQAEKKSSYDSIPSYKRYEIAAELAKKNNDKPLEIGKLYLNAAWCCRQIGAIFKNDPAKRIRNISKLPTAFEDAWKSTAKKLKPSRNRAQASSEFYKKLAEDMDKFDIPENEMAQTSYILARRIRSTGENQLAIKWLNKSLKQDPSLKENIEAIKNSIKKEAFYQRKATKWFEKGISESELQPNQKQELLVTLADTYRRIGNFDKSVETYLQIFELQEISPIIIELAQKAFKAMGRSDKFPTQKLEQIEKNNIEKALTALEEPIGRGAARFLREVENRELVYPKLVELIKKDIKFIAQNALRAMSDDTAEAIKLQTELFARNKYRDIILRNLRQLSTSIPADPLLEVFNNNEPYNLPNHLIDILAAIDDEKVENALLKTVEDFFTVETIKKISKDGMEELKKHGQQPDLAYRNLIKSLSSSDSLEALNVLERIIDNAHINGYNYGYHLVEDAGTTIEFITNHYFGFSVVILRDREPQFKQPDTDLNNNPYGTAKSNFKKWLDKNKDKDYQKIVYDGFKEAGYKVLPVSDPECLEELIDGLRDKFKPVRYHSYRELEKRTGISFKPIIGRDPDAYPREYGEIIWFYNDWYRKNKENLSFNKEKGQFEIKN